MRLLLDEGFPSPPGFDISAVDQSVEVVALRDFDSSLKGIVTSNAPLAEYERVLSQWSG